MNYLVEIDRKLEELRKELMDLQVARRVFLSLQPTLMPVVKRKGNRKPQSRSTLREAKLLIPTILSERPPILSRDIIKELRTRGLVTSDSTVWKALKELKDTGMLTWDEDTRLYRLAQARKEAS
jgi:hypothetical protein